MRNRFIFDLDGTLVDTQIPFNSFVESELLKIHQKIIITPEELARRFTGMATKKVFKETAPDCDIEFMFKEKWRMMHELVKTKELRCLPKMHELVFELKQNGNELAIASASPFLWIKECLHQAMPHESEITDEKRLINIFEENYFSAESCKNNKPKPDVILMANAVFRNQGNTYTVGDGRGDVLASIEAGLPVFYLSKNEEFDHYPLVTRFESSIELSKYIRKNLM